MKNLVTKAQVLAIVAGLMIGILGVGTAQALVTPENMFDVNTIHTLYIVMNAADFSTMRFSAGNDHSEGPGLVFPDPVTGEYDWWQAYLGQSPTDPNFIDIAIRRKSAPALPSEADPQKFSLKLDISRPGYTPPAQRFGGKKKLSLECGSASSLVSEGLAWNIYNAAGVISGRANWVKVYMSTNLGASYTYMGLYDNVEQIDEEFLEDHMPGRHDYGFLYHHTETLGEVKDTRPLETNPFEFRWYPFDHAGYMTEISTPSDWLTQTPQRVDMGQLLKFAVVENFIANQDGTVNKGNNFYYYDWATNPTDPNLMDPAYKQPRVYFPWDLDTCMIGSATSTPLIDDRKGNLVGGLILEEKLDGTPFGYPTYKANYYSTYRSLIDGPLQTANIQALIATIQTAISAAVDGDPYKEFTAAAEFARLNSYVAARRTYIDGLLNALIPSPLPWSDGFESGDFAAGGWTTQNTDATVITGAKYTGTYGAQLKKTTWIQKLIDTRGFTTIHVQYRRATTGFDAGENIYVDWSTDGINWNNLETIQNATYAQGLQDKTCTSGADNNQNFRIRFLTNASANAEVAYVDDVTVVGTAIPLPSISGYILDLNDVPIDGVLVSANNGGGLDTTDPNGYYEVWVSYNWSGTVTPTDEEYTFAPANRPYSNVLADQTNQDYVGTSIYDLYPDGIIDLLDLDVLCDNWLTTGPGDLNNDGNVDFRDFAEFALVW